MRGVTADPDRLMCQAVETAAYYFEKAYAFFTPRYGEEPPPALLVAYVQACTQDFDTAVRYKGVSEQGSLGEVADALQEVAAAFGAYASQAKDGG